MIPTLSFCTLVAILLTCEQASAKGGSYHTEDRYNPQHIDSLPPEIRSSIVRRCNTPKALHPLASYFDNFKMIVLHLAGLLLALVEFPDFSTPLQRIARSTEKIAGAKTRRRRR